MQKSFNFNNISNNVIIYSLEAQKVLYNYKNTFVGIIKIISILTNKNKFYVDLLQNKTKTETVVELIIKSGSDLIKVAIFNDLFSIEYNDKYYEFKIDFDLKEYYIKLLKYTENKKDKIINQIYYDPYRIKLEIIFENKILYLDIPKETNYLITSDIINYLKKDSDILDLKRIYYKYFYPNQSTLEKSQEAIIEVYIKNNKPVLLDRLIIKNGYINSYILSTEKNGTILSIEGKSSFEKEIKISNYISTKDLDLNKEVNNLLIRSRTINLDIQ